MGASILGAFWPPPVPSPIIPQEVKQEVKRATGYVPPTPKQRERMRQLSKARHGDRIKRAAVLMSLPSKYDARERVPIPMGDQGSCGSCYLYATMWYSFTDAGIRAGMGKAGTFKLSVQWGMDRPRDFGGCNGGWGQEVAEYVCNKGCIAEVWMDVSGTTHNDYPPYEARSGQDRTKPGAKLWAKGWTWGLVSNDNDPSIEEIKAAMVLHGRLNIALDAGGQFGGGAGTITALGRQINHEISVCAYDDDAVNPDGTKGAFLLENQWGKNWGNGGYRWCTYKASKNITDWFWVSAGAPPPPPDGQAPVVTAGAAVAQLGKPFSYQIVASNAPTSYGALGLPAGLTVSQATGKITGTPTAAGSFYVLMSAANAAGTGAEKLSLTVTDAPAPPGPSGSVASVTVNFVDGTRQTFYPIGPTTTLADIQAMMVNPQSAPPAPAADKRWEEQARINNALLDAVQALQRQLLPKEKNK